ncbi:uncharacterized protein LOC128249947 isoform X2 [Octopus bimaculoides]|nr:uncharacterized protein LOC128249947 isoform X2 [Octopus bimaculoides]
MGRSRCPDGYLASRGSDVRCEGFFKFMKCFQWYDRKCVEYFGYHSLCLDAIDSSNQLKMSFQTVLPAAIVVTLLKEN